MGYRPLTKEEHKKITCELTKFYAQLKDLISEREEYENTIVNLRLERTAKNESFLTIADPIRDLKEEIKSIDALIETIRPATPQGEIVCHSCDAKSMALLTPNYNGGDANLYKCQVCDAKYIESKLLFL